MRKEREHADDRGGDDSDHSSIPYQQVPPPALELPARPAPTGYIRTERFLQNEVPDHAATLG